METACRSPGGVAAQEDDGDETHEAAAEPRRTGDGESDPDVGESDNKSDPGGVRGGRSAAAKRADMLPAKGRCK